MSLSRKRRRQLKRLRGQAEDLLEQQRVVLSHAGGVAQEAGRQAKELNAEFVAPRVNSAIESARPVIDRGISKARRTADQVRLVTAPLVASALVGAVNSLDRLENREAARHLQSFGEKSGILKPAKKRRAGSIVAIGLGVAAAAAVGYTLWQAFRSDDELWVAPEDDA
ncbi:DNA/RNA helicase [Leucobacter weissii]|uniref:DNA/RNA helicase n=1 Tax=Leucobacter weissii TaxID=1983706 RepID=A0A939S7S0_9MICO|nr:DNA/RNA helicase [Leucobacter weissii]MBO1901286.1 DNA/RNA helicase [Leucobacter weissii]